MKLLLAFLFVIPFLSSAQIWVEDNATWHYNFSGISQGGYQVVTHTMDTVLSGKLAKGYEIQKMNFYWNPTDGYVYMGASNVGVEYLYASSDTVYRWDDNEFRVLFDFSALVGDQWVFDVDPNNAALMCNDSSKVEVTEVGVENIQGVDYDYIEIETLQGSGKYVTGRFNKRYGGDYMFPQYNNCDTTIAVCFDIVSTLRCFSDDSLDLNLLNEDCEYILTHLGLESNSTGSSLYPNPTSGDVFINNSEIIRIEITSNKGRLVDLLEFKKPVEKFSMGHLKPGIYFLNLYNNEGQIFTKKISLQMTD